MNGGGLGPGGDGAMLRRAILHPESPPLISDSLTRMRLGSSSHRPVRASARWGGGERGVHTGICKSVLACAYVLVCVCLSVHMCIFVAVCVFVCMCTCMWVCTVRVQVCVCMHLCRKT